MDFVWALNSRIARLNGASIPVPSVVRSAPCPVSGFLVAPQFLNPLLQNQLIVRLNLRKGDPHSTIRRVRNPADSHEVGAPVGNPDSHLRSCREGFACLDAAAIQAQVTGSLLNLGF